MKILFCCEFFFPSVGGVQEVTRQLTTRLHRRGHDVSVATTTLKERTSDDYQGVKIHSFTVSGNAANGLTGEIEAYRSFIRESSFDVIFIYAAQQWTLDAILDDIPFLKAVKILVPCGYSGLQDPGYHNYFSRLPEVLRHFDALVYHAREYRDHHYAQQHGLRNSVFIPNGADDREFAEPPTGSFRATHQIAEDEHLFLTVGSFNGAKGHLEIAQAFAQTRFPRKATLLLNGNAMPSGGNALGTGLRKLSSFIKNRGIRVTARFVAARALRRIGLFPDYFKRLGDVIANVNERSATDGKRIIVVNLPREELIHAFFEADLFLFASLIEYSPLVLFEACAAGLPFLTVPVGNACEIVSWTGGGEVCEADTDAKGLTRVDPATFSRHLSKLANQPERMAELGGNGRRAWQEKFNWESISLEYERLFTQLLSKTNKTDSLQ